MTKISFNVPPKIWDSFRSRADGLFLNKAPFLDHMLSIELPSLQADLAGLKLSLRAKRHIAGAMKRTDPTSVNIEVRPETADALRAAVAAHNLVRDAFMTRLLIFLRSTNALLKHLDVPYDSTNYYDGAELAPMPASPFGAMEAVRDDPLYYVRHHVQANHEVGIYRVMLPRALDCAACYLPDEAIAGTSAHRRQQKLAEEVLAELDGRPVQNAKRRRSQR